MNSTLLPTDIVGGTFWLLSMAMFGASIFFLLERTKVATKWHTTMTLLGVVMLVSAVFYHYIKTMWVDTGSAPIILRYLDWILTHTMQIVWSPESRKRRAQKRPAPPPVGFFRIARAPCAP